MYLEVKNNRTHRKSVFRSVSIIECLVDWYRIVHGGKVTILSTHEWSIVKVTEDE